MNADVPEINGKINANLSCLKLPNHFANLLKDPGFLNTYFQQSAVQRRRKQVLLLSLSDS